MQKGASLHFLVTDPRSSLNLVEPVHLWSVLLVVISAVTIYLGRSPSIHDGTFDIECILTIFGTIFLGNWMHYERLARDRPDRDGCQTVFSTALRALSSGVSIDGTPERCDLIVCSGLYKRHTRSTASDRFEIWW